MQQAAIVAPPTLQTPPVAPPRVTHVNLSALVGGRVTPTWLHLHVPPSVCAAKCVCRQVCVPPDVCAARHVCRQNIPAGMYGGTCCVGTFGTGTHATHLLHRYTFFISKSQRTGSVHHHHHVLVVVCFVLLTPPHLARPYHTRLAALPLLPIHTPYNTLPP